MIKKNILGLDFAVHSPSRYALMGEWHFFKELCEIEVTYADHYWEITFYVRGSMVNQLLPQATRDDCVLQLIACMQLGAQQEGNLA